MADEITDRYREPMETATQRVYDMLAQAAGVFWPRGGCDCAECVHELAAAIVDQPGVEVDVVRPGPYADYRLAILLPRGGR